MTNYLIEAADKMQDALLEVILDHHENNDGSNPPDYLFDVYQAYAASKGVDPRDLRAIHEFVDAEVFRIEQENKNASTRPRVEASVGRSSAAP